MTDFICEWFNKIQTAIHFTEWQCAKMRINNFRIQPFTVVANKKILQNRWFAGRIFFSAVKTYDKSECKNVLLYSVR
ncbi:hypothetical protein P2W68_01800 [Chryseobacterium arthrosphaerae]|uniref:hypothetical protein n=1 Tax=Chryseobacterium arthrosphaerae TaxID=651561 RepID=UPI0023E1598B|nr:hypothetical protein [Chryseobacterium arthrosphaerae]WES98358.1 hypothetical protein P2W68_01800 [Chryseobacterium arthrosphaerae]